MLSLCVSKESSVINEQPFSHFVLMTNMLLLYMFYIPCFTFMLVWIISNSQAYSYHRCGVGGISNFWGKVLEGLRM